MQKLEQTLDAAVLAVVAVHGDVGHIVAACGQTGEIINVGNIHEVYLRKSCLAQSLLARPARVHRNFALVRPAAGEHRHFARENVRLAHV